MQGLDITDPVIQRILSKNRRQWGEVIDFAGVHRWLAQFDEQGLEHAKKLLLHFVHYGTTMILREMHRLLFERVLVPAIVKVLLTRRAAESRAEAMNLLPSVLYNTLFVPMTSHGKSGAHMMYEFLKVNKIRRGSRQDISRLRHTGAKHARGVVFMDDFIGTGNQVVDKCWPDIKKVEGIADVEFLFYLALVGLEDGIEEISNHTDLDVHVLQTMDSACKAFSDDSWVFEDPAERIAARSTALQHGQRICPEDPLGYGGCELLLGFQWQPPDNTLPIFWRNVPDQWFAIFPRA